MRRSVRLAGIVLALLVAPAVGGASAGPGPTVTTWPTFHHDSARTGFNPFEARSAWTTSPTSRRSGSE